jgi:hypothetical protein
MAKTNNPTDPIKYGSKKYRDAYNKGTITNYNVKQELHIAKNLPTAKAMDKAPTWLLAQREYESKYPKPAKPTEGPNKALSTKSGREIEWEAKRDKYVAKAIEKNNPILKDKKVTRGERLNTLTDKEQELLLKGNPKYNTSLWQDAKRGVGASVEAMSGQSMPALISSDNYSKKEIKEKFLAASRSPKMNKAGEIAGILAPATVPAKMVQAPFISNYSMSDAMSGTKNDVGLVGDMVTDPLNLVGLGLWGKVSKLGKFGKLDDLYKTIGHLPEKEQLQAVEKMIIPDSHQRYYSEYGELKPDEFRLIKPADYNKNLVETPDEVTRIVYNKSKGNPNNYHSEIQNLPLNIQNTEDAKTLGVKLNPHVFEHRSRMNIGLSTSTNKQAIEKSFPTDFPGTDMWSLSLKPKENSTILNGNDYYNFMDNFKKTNPNLLEANELLQKRGYNAVQKWRNSDEIQWLNPETDLEVINTVELNNTLNQPIEMYKNGGMLKNRLTRYENGGQLNDMKRQKYNVGGFMQAAAPFVGMIPGVGMIAAPAMSLAGGLVSQHEANKELEAANAATNKKNYLQQNMHNEANNYGFMKNGGPIKGGKNPSYDQYVAMKKWWDSMSQEQRESIHQKMEYPSERSIIQRGDKLYNASKALPEIDVVQSKIPSKQKNNIAQKGSNKNLFGDKDPLWENLLEIADPTGITSWDDVGRAWSDGKFDYKDVLEPLGAIPGLGKFAKGVTTAGKFAQGLTTTQKVARGIQGGNVANDLDDIYQDNIKNNNNSKFEFEDGGQLTHFEGPSHEQGGIQIPAMGAEVEGGETMNQDNNYVNSDHLGYDKDGYPTMNPKTVKTTFADASKKIENRYKNKNSFEQIAGEKLSQAMINSDNEKVRPKEPQQSMSQGMPQQQFAYGGTMGWPPLNQNSMNAINQYSNYGNLGGNQNYMTNRSSFPSGMPQGNTIPQATPTVTQSSTSGTRPPGIFSRMKESNSQYTMGDKMNLVGAGIGMASQIPALMAKPERAQMRTYNPIVDRTKYNASPELQALEAGRQGYNQNVRDTTANSSTANARMLAGLSNMNQSASNVLANKQQQDYQRSNLANQTINQGRQYNAQEAARVDDINAQNRAGNLYSKQQSSLNMGQQLAGTGQYFNELASQQTQFALLQDMYSEYGMSGENFADFLRRIKMGESAVQYKQN